MHLNSVQISPMRVYKCDHMQRWTIFFLSISHSIDSQTSLLYHVRMWEVFCHLYFRYSHCHLTEFVCRSWAWPDFEIVQRGWLLEIMLSKFLIVELNQSIDRIACRIYRFYFFYESHWIQLSFWMDQSMLNGYKSSLYQIVVCLWQWDCNRDILHWTPSKLGKQTEHVLFLRWIGFHGYYKRPN